jgi:Ser/Thr protein kinase RdoA (MazF antagonist)
MDLLISEILTAYSLHPSVYRVSKLDSGLINHTWKVSGLDEAFILQKVNSHVFKSPENIADNLQALNGFIQKAAPDYLFVAPLLAASGNPYIKTGSGDYFRLFPFIKNSHTINTVNTANEAYEAARQFGMFTRLFDGFDLDKLHYTLADFHNLPLRIDQFNQACTSAAPDLLNAAIDEVNKIKEHFTITHDYSKLMVSSQLPLRLIHHDTKISNILFDENNKGLCVIDLDTVMPGYFLSDVGDMLRTYLSPANEEEKDFDKIIVRRDFFRAIYSGYTEQMGSILTPSEKNNFIFAGKFMIYMQAVRFLTDYLNKDIYYQTTYPGHNLIRARNQLNFLEKYLKAEPRLNELLSQ